MKIVIYNNGDGWRWSLTSRNGKNIANGGEGYDKAQKMVATLHKYIVRDDDELVNQLNVALQKAGLTSSGAKMK